MPERPTCRCGRPMKWDDTKKVWYCSICTDSSVEDEEIIEDLKDEIKEEIKDELEDEDEDIEDEEI